MRMRGRFGEDVFDDAPGQFACALVLLEDDENGKPGFDL